MSKVTQAAFALKKSQTIHLPFGRCQNPMADKDGYVYLANVNEMTEMVEMMAAARSYQNNVEVVNTTRQMLMRTIDIIKT
jgi:flagellar basal-body rod protein FlgC